MSGDRHAAPSEPSGDDGRHPPFFRRMIRLLTPWGVKHALLQKFSQIDAGFADLGSRIDRLERRLDGVEAAIRDVQSGAADLRDARLAPLERRLDSLENAAHELSHETSRLRDGVIPAMVARGNALTDRLAEELAETASLVERMLWSEPLPVGPAEGVDEALLADALATVQPRLLESFRGSESEIGHRLDAYLDDLKANPPVLDLGCGRGELLLMLREAGVEATGIEGDAALAAAAVRRGLRVVEGDAIAALRRVDAGAFGSVTAIHLLEHLQPTQLAVLVAEVRRILRPGGLFLAECPNPHALRVGGALFWQDPTHVRPLLPETLELYLRSAGFQVTRCEFMRPFPDDQLFSTGSSDPAVGTGEEANGLTARLERIEARLDEILNGPRDFAVWAVAPQGGPGNERDDVDP